MRRLYYGDECRDPMHTLFYLEFSDGQVVERTEEIHDNEINGDAPSYMQTMGTATAEALRGGITNIEEARIEFCEMMEDLGYRSPGLGDINRADTDTVKELIDFMYSDDQFGPGMVEQVGFDEAVEQLDPALVKKIGSNELAMLEDENYHELVRHFSFI